MRGSRQHTRSADHLQPSHSMIFSEYKDMCSFDPDSSVVDALLTGIGSPESVCRVLFPRPSVSQLRFAPAPSPRYCSAAGALLPAQHREGKARQSESACESAPHSSTAAVPLLCVLCGVCVSLCSPRGVSEWSAGPPGDPRDGILAHAQRQAFGHRIRNMDCVLLPILTAAHDHRDESGTVPVARSHTIQPMRRRADASGVTGGGAGEEAHAGQSARHRTTDPMRPAHTAGRLVSMRPVTDVSVLSLPWLCADECAGLSSDVVAPGLRGSVFDSRDRAIRGCRRSRDKWATAQDGPGKKKTRTVPIRGLGGVSHTRKHAHRDTAMRLHGPHLAVSLLLLLCCVQKGVASSLCCDAQSFRVQLFRLDRLWFMPRPRVLPLGEAIR